MADITTLLYDAVIGKIVSNLNLKEYNNFQQTNKIIHNACNSPCTIQDLGLLRYGSNLQIYQKIPFHKFPLLNRLDITLDAWFNAMHSFSIFNRKQMNNLKTLSLLNHNVDVGRIALRAGSHLSKFSAQNYLFFKGLTRLELNHFLRISAETLLEFISKTPNIQELYFLDVVCFYENNHITVNQLQQYLLNVKSIQVKLLCPDDNMLQYIFFSDIITATSNQLEHLTIHQNSESFSDTSIGTDATFGELKSCRLKNFNFDTANKILSTAYKLKTIHLSHETEGHIAITADQYENIMLKILDKTHLKSINITACYRYLPVEKIYSSLELALAAHQIGTKDLQITIEVISIQLPHLRAEIKRLMKQWFLYLIRYTNLIKNTPSIEHFTLKFQTNIRPTDVITKIEAQKKCDRIIQYFVDDYNIESGVKDCRYFVKLSNYNK